MGILADVWPGDRENIMQAGARLEEAIEVFEGKSTLLKDLIGQAYKALIHMYEKDEFFFSIRAATLQAVNTIREFAANDGDVAVEVFEKAYGDLEKALAGKAESLMEQDVDVEREAVAAAATKDAGPEAGDTPAPAELPEGGVDAEGEPPATDEEISETADEISRPVEDVPSVEVTLDDLASVVMQLTEENISGSLMVQLENIVDYLARDADSAIAAIMQELRVKLSGFDGAAPDAPAGLIAYLSEKVEVAVALEMNSDVVMAQDGQDGQNGSVADPTPVAVDLPDSGDKAGGAEEFRVPDDLDTSLLQDFITECNEQIEAAESALLDLEASPDDAELVNMVFRSFHTIKGTSAFMGLTPMSEFAHMVETLLDMVRDGHHGYDSACADITLTSIDIIKSFLEKSEVLQGGDVLEMPNDYGWLMDVLVRISEFGFTPEEALTTVQGRSAAGGAQKNVMTTAQDSSACSVQPANQQGDAGESDVQSGATPAQAGSAAAKAVPSVGEPGPSAENSAAASTREQNGQQGRQPTDTESGRAKRSDSEASVRVNVERLDRVIDMVGELVIAHSVVAQSGLIASDPDLSRKVSHSSKILRELQDTSLSLRMVPLKATFQKMNRLVRDLARKSGKTVTYGTEGEDTEIDRNMVDIINEPLVHLLRNALDHGIEDVETRQKSGKPGIARIWLRAFQAGGKVIIEIEDDGKGLDKEKILAKALSKGLVEPNRKLSDGEIYKLIFLPGFSTADKVSDLSGRGVGMDVVRRSIDKLQGKVEVHSTPGKGTKISLELPFTLAITDGMLVRIGSQQFIVPTINIDMTFRAKEEELFTILGDTEQVRFRGNSIPVIRLHRMFGVRDAIENIEEATLLVINNNKKKYALLVDEVVGQQQLVGKSIDMPVKMRNISGGAILGDGRVGLILDTVALLN